MSLNLNTDANTHGTQKFPPLNQETRPAVGTKAAAYYLGLKVQTLHEWSHFERGPLRPRKVGARLMWRVADIKAALGEE